MKPLAIEHMELHARRLLEAEATQEAVTLARNIVALAEELRRVTTPMRALVRYSDPYEAKAKGWPRQGSLGTFCTLIGFAKVQAEQFEGNRMILHPPGEAGAPGWAEFMEVRDEEEADSDWTVRKLPDDWKSLRWVEVYNGMRE